MPGCGSRTGAMARGSDRGRVRLAHGAGARVGFGRFAVGADLIRDIDIMKAPDSLPGLPVAGCSMLCYRDLMAKISMS